VDAIIGEVVVRERVLRVAGNGSASPRTTAVVELDLDAAEIAHLISGRLCLPPAIAD
jgi:hypothetical protein